MISIVKTDSIILRNSFSIVSKRNLRLPMDYYKMFIEKSRDSKLLIKSK